MRATRPTRVALLCAIVAFVGLGLLIGIVWFISLPFALLIGVIVVTLDHFRGANPASSQSDSFNEFSDSNPSRSPGGQFVISAKGSPMVPFGSGKLLNPLVEACLIGSEASDRRAVARFQDALLKNLVPGEDILWVAADIDSGGGMAATSEALLSFYKSRLWARLPGARIADTEIRQSPFFGDRRHKFKHSFKVSWTGGPLADSSRPGQQFPNMFFWITRWDYDEIERMDLILRREFEFE